MFETFYNTIYKELITINDEKVIIDISEPTIDRVTEIVINELKVNREDALNYIYFIIETGITDFIAHIALNTKRKEIEKYYEVVKGYNSITEFIEKNFNFTNGFIKINREDILKMFAIVCSKHKECTSHLIGEINLVIAGKLERLAQELIEKHQLS